MTTSLPGPMVTAAWLADHIADVVVCDTRWYLDGRSARAAFDGGHIPGALHIDWREFFKEDGQLKSQNLLMTLLNKHGIKQGMEIVVYCTGGVRSAMAYFVFRKMGFKVRNYDGSWWDWSHNPALPVETS